MKQSKVLFIYLYIYFSYKEGKRRNQEKKEVRVERERHAYGIKARVESIAVTVQRVVHQFSYQRGPQHTSDFVPLITHRLLLIAHHSLTQIQTCRCSFLSFSLAFSPHHFEDLFLSHSLICDIKTLDKKTRFQISNVRGQREKEVRTTLVSACLCLATLLTFLA